MMTSFLASTRALEELSSRRYDFGKDAYTVSWRWITLAAPYPVILPIQDHIILLRPLVLEGTCSYDDLLGCLMPYSSSGPDSAGVYISGVNTGDSQFVMKQLVRHINGGTVDWGLLKRCCDTATSMAPSSVLKMLTDAVAASVPQAATIHTLHANYMAFLRRMFHPSAWSIVDTNSEMLRAIFVKYSVAGGGKHLSWRRLAFFGRLTGLFGVLAKPRAKALFRQILIAKKLTIFAAAAEDADEEVALQPSLAEYLAGLAEEHGNAPPAAVKKPRARRGSLDVESSEDEGFAFIGAPNLLATTIGEAPYAPASFRSPLPTPKPIATSRKSGVGASIVPVPIMMDEQELLALSADGITPEQEQEIMEDDQVSGGDLERMLVYPEFLEYIVRCADVLFLEQIDAFAASDPVPRFSDPLFRNRKSTQQPLAAKVNKLLKALRLEEATRHTELTHRPARPSSAGQHQRRKSAGRRRSTYNPMSSIDNSKLEDHDADGATSPSASPRRAPSRLNEGRSQSPSSGRLMSPPTARRSVSAFTQADETKEGKEDHSSRVTKLVAQYTTLLRDIAGGEFSLSQEFEASSEGSSAIAVPFLQLGLGRRDVPLRAFALAPGKAAAGKKEAKPPKPKPAGKVAVDRAPILVPLSFSTREELDRKEFRTLLRTTAAATGGIIDTPKLPASLEHLEHDINVCTNPEVLATASKSSKKPADGAKKPSAGGGATKKKAAKSDTKPPWDPYGVLRAAELQRLKNASAMLVHAAAEDIPILPEAEMQAKVETFLKASADAQKQAKQADWIIKEKAKKARGKNKPAQKRPAKGVIIVDVPALEAKAKQAELGSLREVPADVSSAASQAQSRFGAGSAPGNATGPLAESSTGEPLSAPPMVPAAFEFPSSAFALIASTVAQSLEQLRHCNMESATAAATVDPWASSLLPHASHVGGDAGASRMHMGLSQSLTILPRATPAPHKALLLQAEARKAATGRPASAGVRDLEASHTMSAMGLEPATKPSLPIFNPSNGFVRLLPSVTAPAAPRLPAAAALEAAHANSRASFSDHFKVPDVDELSALRPKVPLKRGHSASVAAAPEHHAPSFEHLEKMAHRPMSFTRRKSAASDASKLTCYSNTSSFRYRSVLRLAGSAPSAGSAATQARPATALAGTVLGLARKAVQQLPEMHAAKVRYGRLDDRSLTAINKCTTALDAALTSSIPEALDLLAHSEKSWESSPHYADPHVAYMCALKAHILLLDKDMASALAETIEALQTLKVQRLSNASQTDIRRYQNYCVTALCFELLATTSFRLQDYKGSALAYASCMPYYKAAVAATGTIPAVLPGSIVVELKTRMAVADANLGCALLKHGEIAEAAAAVARSHAVIAQVLGVSDPLHDQVVRLQQTIADASLDVGMDVIRADSTLGLRSDAHSYATGALYSTVPLRAPPAPKGRR